MSAKEMPLVGRLGIGPSRLAYETEDGAKIRRRETEIEAAAELTRLQQANAALVEREKLKNTVLRECLADYSHPNFTDRRGQADRIRAALAQSAERT